MTRNPACAICGCDTKPLRFSEWDGRMVTACKPCLSAPKEPSGPESAAERVFRVVKRMPGSNAGDICEAMGAGEEGVSVEQDRLREVIYQWLSKLARRGSLRTEGSKNNRLYYAVSDDLVPKARKQVEEKKEKSQRTDEDRAKAKAYRHKIRDQRMALGLCIKCGKAKERLEVQECAACKKAHCETNWLYRGSARGNKKARAAVRRHYRKHGRKIRARRRDRYWERKVEGICNRCGFAPSAEDSTHCVDCAPLSREASRLAMKNLRIERIAAGVCCRCGKRPPETGGTSCKKCRAKVRKWKAHHARRAA